MSIEIERKYLVKSLEFKKVSNKQYRIKQGFLNSDKNRVVRIRIRDDKGFITIKGKSSNDGLSRFEWEQEISLKDAESLYAMCEPGIIDKTRFEVPWKGYLIEVDEFHKQHQGLIIAEIELNDESEKPDLPNWIEKEVTGNPEYYNVNLSKKGL